MRIGIDARFLTHPQKGGFKTYTENLISALAKVDHRNHYFLFLDRNPSSFDILPKQDNFTYIVLNGIMPYMGMILREQIGLPWMSIKYKLDILHSPCLTSPIIKSCPSVVTVHDLIWMHPTENGPSDFYRTLMNKYYKIVAASSAKKADLILTVSNYSKTKISNTFKKDLNRIIVTYEAANRKYRILDDTTRIEEVRKKHNLANDYILAIGSADPSNIRKKYFLVIICTHSHLLSEFISEIDALDIGETTQLLGNISDADLVVIYNAASLFIFPSKSEGFGLPLLEAMACGVPCITAKNSSIPEVAGDAAFLINEAVDAAGFSEKINILLTNPDERHKLIQRGFDQVSKFSWEKCAQETLAAYDLAVSQ